MNEKNLVDPIRFQQPNINSLTFRDIDIFSDDIGANRQLAGAAVDQNRDENSFRLAKTLDRFHRRANRAPAVNHVVNQDDGLVVDHRFSFEGADGRAFGRCDSIVAERRYVDRRDRWPEFPEFLNVSRQPARKVNAAGPDADQH